MMVESKLKLPALDPASVAVRRGTSYPDEFKWDTEKREKQALGDAAGLTRFGVNLVRLKPGAGSALRHWHAHEDEFVYVLEGEITLITDAGEQILGSGMAAGFPGGKADGHKLINNSSHNALYLEIGDRHPAEEVHYPDVDLHGKQIGDAYVFTRKDGGKL